MTALVAGWFSVEGGEATAGDLLVRDVVCEWLDEAGVAYDLAQERRLGAGVDWFRVDPARYTHLLLVCGPVGPELAVAEIAERFAGCRRVAVGVSLVGDPAWRPFDVVLARDGRDEPPRPDLSLAAPSRPVPVVARAEIHRQAEYAGVRPADAHAAFDRLLAANPAAVVHVETRLDPAVPGRRSSAEVEALVAVADVMLTTRLHGLVLALRAGVPALAVDAVPGGAKVIAQAAALGWPAALAIDDLDEAELARWYAWCLGEEARTHARATAEHARLHGVAEVRASLLAELAGERRPFRRP